MCETNGRQNDETFRHVFLECPEVKLVFGHIKNKLLNGLINNNEDEKEFIFGNGPNTIQKSIFIRTIKCMYLYLIWEYRLKHKKLIWQAFKCDLKSLVNDILKRNQKINNIRMLNFDLSRRWDEL